MVMVFKLLAMDFVMKPIVFAYQESNGVRTLVINTADLIDQGMAGGP